MTSPASPANEPASRPGSTDPEQRLGTSLSIESLSRRFADSTALDGISLEASPGECIVVLGASGCGKSTLLRLVAGLERPDQGRICLGGRVVSDEHTFVPSEQRGVGVVFQSYALWPHMDVAAHARFPLEAAGVRGKEADRRVATALEMVGLQALSERQPAELSGGQRQRVALARCLAQSASLILMDEPLANLDPHLRSSMEQEIDRVRRETGATLLYITHDQREAMALADRIAVLVDGRLQQLASPETLYSEPATRAVAGFIGAGSFISAEPLSVSSDRPGRSIVRVGDAVWHVRSQPQARRSVGTTMIWNSGAQESTRLLIRPESVQISDHVEAGSGSGSHSDSDSGPARESSSSTGADTGSGIGPSDGSDKHSNCITLSARVRSVTFRGDHHELSLYLDSGETILARSPRAREPGVRVQCTIHDAWLVPADE